MATNLVGPVCIGHHDVCLMRVAALDTDCTILGGADQGVVSTAIVTATASPVVEEGRRIEPKNGCGTVSYSFVEPSVIKGYTINAELVYHDLELKYLLFGGSLITGAVGSDFAGKAIGHALPHYLDAQSNGVYMEFLVRNVSAEAGECSSGGTEVPYATGYIFGKVRAVPGDLSMQADNIPLTFTANAEANPNLFDGPWNDYPGSGYIPNSPALSVQYSRDEYDAIAAASGCGYVTLPAGS